LTVRTGNSLGRLTAHRLAIVIAATGLSGCMPSALDLSSTYTTAPTPSLALTGNDTLPVPRPTADIASAGTYMDPGATGDETTVESVMALAGSEPSSGSPALGADMPVQQAMIDQGTGAIIPDDTAQGQTVALIPLGDQQAGNAPIADAATARIYGAGAAPTAVAPPPPVISTAPKRSNGFLALFSNNRSNGARRAVLPPQPVSPQPAVAEMWTASAGDSKPAEPLVIATASASGATAGLPGVDRERTLGLDQTRKQESSEPEDAPIQLASAAGLARLAPNGLHIQHDKVDIACLKPALVRVLKQVERHYGRNVVVTSGYRTPSRNKKARGAENSLHIYCSAADIQVEDVSKWELASYLRAMPGRGGVGTYCYTDSVHIDIGPQRDWNWRCRRRK
jgi:uncharacterized protein YcbK (DUF882 family)